MAEIILFEHINFHGEYKHLFTSEPDLNAIDNFFSMIDIILRCCLWRVVVFQRC